MNVWHCTILRLFSFQPWQVFNTRAVKKDASEENLGWKEISIQQRKLRPLEVSSITIYLKLLLETRIGLTIGWSKKIHKKFEKFK
jgi:hypothetical protein